MKKNVSTLVALTTAALMLPKVSKATDAADPDNLEADPDMTLDYRYSRYQEGQVEASKLAGGSATRYVIDVHQLKFKAMLAAGGDLNVSAVHESMSGASPWYVQPDSKGNLLQVMSGASIVEKRSQLDLGVHNAGQRTDFTFSIGYSKENDYSSLGAGISGALYFNEKLTTIDYVLNASQDRIDAVDADRYVTRPTKESKTHVGAVLGLSQVLTKTTLVGVSVSGAFQQGYLSDPYKLALVEGITVQDSRPQRNKQLTNAVMLRQFVPFMKAALHIDYRYFRSDWKLESDTIEVSWYQNLGNGWQLVPSMRKYKQIRAVFYQPYYLARRTDNFYSSDYRLSSFSADSVRIKLSKRFTSFDMNLAYETYKATGKSPGLVNYNFFSLGLGARF